MNTDKKKLKQVKRHILQEAATKYLTKSESFRNLGGRKLKFLARKVAQNRLRFLNK